MSGIINTSATRISFIRHGQVHNPDHIFYGRLPGFKLNHHGRKESARASEAFKDTSIDGIYSSPMLRSRQTANEVLKNHPRLKLSISSLITEVFSAFQGRPNSKLARYQWNIYANKDPKFERPEEVFRRTQKFILRTRKRHFGRHVAAVTHGDVILFIIFHAKRIPVTAANKLNLEELGILEGYPSTGSITMLTYQTTDMAEIPDMSYVIP